MDQNNDTKAVEKVAEETVPETSPAPEEPTTEVQTDASDVSQTMNEEQRNAFQEQRLEIKRLKEEQQSRKTSESAFAPFRPQAPSVGVDVNRYTDPNTGVTDWNSYNTAVVQNAGAVATQAATEVIDEARARDKYPELFNDSDTEKLIADTWLASKMRGENLAVTQIAERLSKRFGRAVSKAEKLGAEKMLQEVSPKEQANMAPSVTSASAQKSTSTEELEQLRIQSRGLGRSSEEAVAKRMKAIPWK